MSSRDMSRMVWLALIAITFVSPTRADDAWPPASANDLKMTAEPKAPGAPAIFLYRQVDRNDLSGREVDFARIKILTEEGRKYASLEIPFIKDVSQVKSIKARTIQPDGATAEFNGQIYDKAIVKAKGVRLLAKTLTLPDVHVGTIIEYSFLIDLNSEYVYDSRWVISTELFTRTARFSLKPDFNLAIQWSCPVGLPVGTEPPVSDGKYFRLETHDVPAFQIEDFMPPENTLKFRVEFTYSNQDFEMDEVKFWKREGQRWYAWLDAFIDRRKAMERAVAQIVVLSDSQEAKLQKIYARVQQIRNTSFEHERTQQEEKRAKQKEVNNAEDVWKRGYGGSRDINWLFVALLRAASLDAHCVLVSSRASYFFDPKALNANQLNTDVVVVKLSGKDLYLDPGAKFAPFGLLPWYETQVKGLLLDKDGGRWVQTTTPDSAAAKTERKADLTLSEDGALEGKVTVTFGGLEALQLRTEQRDEDDTSRKAVLEGLVKDALPNGAEVELTNRPDWISAIPTLVAEYHVKVHNWVSPAGKRFLFPLGLFGSSERNVFDHAERVHPLYFRHPYLKSDDITVKLPAGWTVGTLPAPINRDASAIVYTAKSEDKNGSLHVDRMLQMNIFWLPRDQYSNLRRFFQVVRTGDDQPVVLLPAS